MQGMVTHGFVQLRDYISDLEDKWKSKQGLCGGLDAHKNAFAIFPSHNNYASVLCGSLTLIISAAVNHDEIADTIAETVTKITEKAARAAKILLVLHTRAIRELFSELYAQVFLFYRDAIEWYMKSKASRLFGNFNEKMKERYENAAEKIEDDYAFSRMQRTEQERRDEILLQRQQTFDSFTLACAGRNAQQLLLSSHKRACVEASTTDNVGDDNRPGIPAPAGMAQTVSSSMARGAAKSLSVVLEQSIVGSEGHSLLNNGMFWRPGSDVAIELHNWIDIVATTPTLWISSPDISSLDVSASCAAAMNILVVAWETNLPVVSHFCERPRFATLAEGRDVEKLGLIGLVYSVIFQLLQFSFDDEEFEIPEGDMRNLDGSDESWPQALDLLSALLKATPRLALCVVDGLNELAFAAGEEWCGAFLEVLFEHQRSTTPGTFKVLLTTSGQSRVLQDHVQVTDRMFTHTGAQEVIRGGRWVKSSKS
ncbi:hypothetical protein BDW02DRAFT_603293 [Decorospora gaudefroyi]|uniref:DUF7708 domain-containing protein n=1 Tax=Decorospora gaudefroyi TaxID=184978 RepID=A0A6A5JX83_9PLEO|nr:hypothetical protein BDW02DRAFT_603293 [Decorospora gaudefroyi]